VPLAAAASGAEGRTNHWLLDCVAGVAATLLACGIVSVVSRAGADRRRRRSPAATR
jgi:hypothetical protein